MISPHIIGSVSPHLERLRRWQPRLILVLDPSPDQISSLRQACPNSFIIGRIYRPDSEVDHRIRASPAGAAQWAHDAIMQSNIPQIDAWQVENEVLQQWDGLPLLNEYALKRMELADRYGYKAAILGFSVGNPDLPEHDRMALWRQVYPALTYAEDHDHVVVVHQYGSPGLWDPAADWYIHRLEKQVLPRLPHSRVKFACTEFGIDNLINGFHPGPSGWRNTTNAQNYRDDLINIGTYLERYQDRVIGYAVFTLGHNPPWHSYDIDGAIAEGLASHYAGNPQPVFTWDGTGGDGDGANGGPGPDPVVVPFVPNEIVRSAVYSRVRAQAGFGGAPIGVLPPNFYPYVLGGPVEADGLVWWNISGVTTEGKHVVGWTAQYDTEQTILLEKVAGPLLGKLAAPYAGQYPVTQLFGENPHWYASFGLRGHNGLDLGVPIGTPLQAVDGGWAFQVLDDPPGYGKFVKLQHPWGESLYAHLSSWAIAPGQQVTKGQVIGYSGNTGNSTGPHLHFAMRINPYDLSDDWRGYSDPLPWLPVGSYRLPNVPTPVPVPDPPPEPPPAPDPTPPPPPQVERRTSASYAAMHMEIQPLDAVAGADVVYLVKDVFTTQDGSWEVGHKPPPYGIEQWARDSYLKPWNAPDYFDDAGGATHLFGAVLGLDGKLLRNHPMRWHTKDGQNRHEMNTKDRSGWANMFMSPGSTFWPDQGQTGFWCWAPDGVAEQVCGGGLPNQWHVSTFVVWQAVRRT